MDILPQAECTSDTVPQKAEVQDQCSGNNNENIQQQKNETNEQDKSLSPYCFR